MHSARSAIQGPSILSLWLSKMRTGTSERLLPMHFGEIGDTKAVDPLIEALKDGTVLVRKAASEALATIEG